MASIKQYQVGFLFSAALNGGFKGTLSKAQQEFSRLGTEIQKLNRLQSDIASYQKQQTAVEKTAAKLENLQKQHDLLQKEISETDGSTGALERQDLQLQQRIADTTAALERQRQKLDATGKNLSDAGVNTEDLTGETERLTRELRELQEQQDRVSDSAEDFGQRAAEGFDAAGQALAAAGIVDSLKEVARAYAQCVEAAAGFQQSMSTVAALSGANATEMAALTEKAKEMGATTKYTAQESADAFGYMALAGWDAEKQIAGIAPILNLAAAANMDLAQTSDIVTDYLTAFGLTADDAASFADKMAYAMSHSNTNVEQLGEAYKGCAATAKSLGYSVEETTAVLMGMANAGVKGGEAGTAVNAIMTRLATNAKDCADALGEYGVQIYDTRGNMNSLSSILNGTVEIWGDLTDAQQAHLAKLIAGTNHYSAFQTIMTACGKAAAEGGQSFNDYAAALQDCSGAAGDMAATMLDNLNGDLTIMNSALDAVRLTLGEQFNPELRALTQAGTEVLGGIDRFIQENPALVKGLTVTVGLLTAGSAAVLGVSAAVKAFQALNVAALFTGPAGAILAAVAGVATLTGALVAAREEATSMQREVDELTASARAMDETLSGAGTACDDTAAATQAAADVASGYVEKLRAIEAAGMDTDARQQEYQHTLALLLQTMPELSDCISQTTDQYGRTTYAIQGSTDALQQNIDAVKKNAMAQATQDRLTKLYSQYSDVLVEAQVNSIKLTDAQKKLDDASGKYNSTLAEMTALEEQAQREYQGFDTVIYPDRYYELRDALAAANEEVEQAEEDVEKYKLAIEDGNNTIAAAEEEISLMEEAIKDLSDPMQQAAGDGGDLTAVMEQITQEAQNLSQAYNEAYNAALESFQGQFGLFDEAEADMDATVANAQKALDSQLKYWENYSKNIEILKNTSAADLGITQDNYDRLMNFVRSGNTEAAGLADSMVKAIQGGNKQAVSELANTAGEISLQQDSVAAMTAEWQVGISDMMNEMEQEVTDTVKAMDLSEEAAESGRATILSYIQQANSMLPLVRNAYARLGDAALNALGMPTLGRSHTSSSSRNSSSSKIASSMMSMPGMDGYASGTDSAAPGLKLVGEEGPELVVFQGGEKVLNAVETARTIQNVTNVYQQFYRELSAYATGTTNAEPGLALVGEEGPEIVLSREQKFMKYAAAEQARVNQALSEYGGTTKTDNISQLYQEFHNAYGSSSGGIPELGSVSRISASQGIMEVPEFDFPSDDFGGGVNVEVHIHLEAGAAPETVSALEDYVRSGELKEVVQEAMEDLQRNAGRLHAI